MESVLTEHELVVQARQGSTDSFKELYDVYHVKVLNFVMRLVKEKADAEDIVQEVFVKMYQKLPTLREPDFFSTWLFRIAKNDSVNFLRKRQGRRIEPLEAGPDNESMRQLVSSDCETNRNVEQTELEQAVQSALDAMPENSRMAFVLGVIEGHTYREVSKVIGCSVNNVKALVFRARSALVQQLAPYL